VRSPAEDAYQVTGVGPDRLERPVQRRSADGVEDDVEAFAASGAGHIVCDRGGLVVDRPGAEACWAVDAVELRNGGYPLMLTTKVLN